MSDNTRGGRALFVNFVQRMNSSASLESVTNHINNDQKASSTRQIAEALTASGSLLVNPEP